MKKTIYQDTPRPKRSYRRRLRSFSFPLPKEAQLMVIELPEVSRYLKGKEKLMKVLEGIRLMNAGFSLNQSAKILGLAPSVFCTWRDAYLKGGEQALVPSHTGRPSKNHGVPPCRLSMLLS